MIVTVNSYRTFFSLSLIVCCVYTVGSTIQDPFVKNGFILHSLEFIFYFSLFVCHYSLTARVKKKKKKYFVCPIAVVQALPVFHLLIIIIVEQ